MEENSLRWVLLGLGVLTLVGIYLYDIWKTKALLKNNDQAEEGLPDKIDPVISHEVMPPKVCADDPVIEPVEVPSDEPTVADLDPVPTKPLLEEVPVARQALVVQLAVVAKPGDVMCGGALLEAFKQLNLEFGNMGVFHRLKQVDAADMQVFHVANVLEPGTFPVSNMDDFESTGIVLFFQSSDLVDSNLVLDDMLATAKELCQLLGANLLDADMNELGDSKITEIRAQLSGLSGL